MIFSNRLLKKLETIATIISPRKQVPHCMKRQSLIGGGIIILDFAVDRSEMNATP